MSLWKTLSRMIGLEATLAHLESGKAAPGFTLKTYQGSSLSLLSLLEQGPVVLAFFKVSCPVCQFTFPFLERLYERVETKVVSVIGISQDDVRDTKEFCEEYGVKFPILLDDSSYAVSNAYGITNVPTVFLIEPDGKIKMDCMGFAKTALEQITAEVENHSKISATPLFRSDEIIPAYKPG